MTNPFTVVWDRDAEDELTRMWIENPRVRQEIGDAADRLDQLLAIDPLELGIQSSRNMRQCVQPPLKVLFKISEPDRVVRVLYVKFWID